MKMSWKIVAAGATVAAVAAATGGRLFDTLIVNGKSHQADVRIINGNAYVRLADVAKAFDMTLARKGEGQYELTKAGGANQVSGLTGKIGDVLFDGKWRFTVLSVETPSTFTMKTESPAYDKGNRVNWHRPTRVLTPTKGNMLVVVNVRVANGVNERRTLWTAISDPRIRTALADMDGGSHAPVAYDFAGGPIQTDWILPGAQVTFPVIFSVPEGTKMKDLIFTLKNNQGDQQGTDVRVSLTSG